MFNPTNIPMFTSNLTSKTHFSNIKEHITNIKEQHP